jgi:hypothetical protein
MVAKTFKGGVDSLLGESKEKDYSGKRGRPRVNVREITKTSQSGTKENETRATFIMNEEQLESVKAMAYWDRISIKDALCEAVDDYLIKKKSDLQKAITAYKNKTKK